MFDGLRFLHWKPELRDDGILMLGLDRADSRVNTLAQAVLDEFNQILERIEISPPKGVLIHSLKEAGFIAGADISEFQEFDAKGTVYDSIRRGQLVLQRLAELPCPTVAAIHGHCMGGGTELALACTYRVASNDDSTRIALPEVMLGIYPGWGGSVRLPPLVGAPAAMDMMLTGRGLRASQARAIGLVDKRVEQPVLLDAAMTLLQRGASRPIKQRFMGWATNIWPVRQILAPMMQKQVARKAPKAHYPAPYALINTWRSTGGSIDKRLKAEAKSVTKLGSTPTARNLIRVYFLQERLKGLGGKDHGIKNVHVIGAGVMGGDIAAWCALKGFEVSLQDREQKYIDPAMARAAKLFEKKVRDETKRAATTARLKSDVEGKHVADANLVIEAIYENPEAKKALYEQVEKTLPKDAILTTNTSSIPLTELRTDIDDPKRFAGLHYFNPVAMMPLVEIVRHDKMDEETGRRLAAFCRAIGKLPVPVAGSPGFLVNRILMPYMLES
ncbi:MAG: 3-hydroxyacyl-CoA dehydrogenase NAD-binding domain-containing protein, partial [Lysobacteraceae bacterium]